MKYELYDNGVVVEEKEIDTSIDVMSQITALEGQITQRRIREAVLTPEGKAWLQSIEDQIKTLRTKL